MEEIKVYQISIEMLIAFYAGYRDGGISFRVMSLDKSYQGVLKYALESAVDDYRNMVADYALKEDRVYPDLPERSLSEEVRCILAGEKTRGLIEYQVVPEAVLMRCLSRHVAPVFI